MLIASLALDNQMYYSTYFVLYYYYCIYNTLKVHTVYVQLFAFFRTEAFKRFCFEPLKIQLPKKKKTMEAKYCIYMTDFFSVHFPPQFSHLPIYRLIDTYLTNSIPKLWVPNK